MFEFQPYLIFGLKGLKILNCLCGYQLLNLYFNLIWSGVMKRTENIIMSIVKRQEA